MTKLQKCSTKYYLYIILTLDNTLYCGIARDLIKRFNAHVQGHGAKYTKSHKPLKIVYAGEFENRSEASKEEYRIKTLKKEQKLDLIEKNKEKTKEILNKFR